MSWQDWPAYIPVAQRRAIAKREMERLRKQGQRIEPIVIEGRRITRTFWGDAWCAHLQSFASIANRLDRGRTYVRNGSICHLEIQNGLVRALVMGTELYEVQIDIKPLGKARWQQIRERCAGNVGSLVDLLQGRLSDPVMAVVTNRAEGLFPKPREIESRCSCPDFAVICKHVAAVYYGVGARLDKRPELLFALRGVDHEALVDDHVQAVTTLTLGGSDSSRIADDNLSDVFGIELDDDDATTGDVASTAAGRAGRKARGQRKPTGKSATPPPAPAPGRSRTGRGGRQARATTERPTTRTTKVRPSTPPSSVPSKVATESPKIRAARPRVTPPDTGGRRDSRLPQPLRPAHILALRERLGVSRPELGKLLDMSAAAIGVWERRTTALTLQPASREALQRVWHMSRESARRRLAGR